MHPDYKTVGLDDLTAFASQIAEANLEPGIRVTIDLGANDAAKKEIEGSLAKMKIRDQASVDWRTFWRTPRSQRVISQGVTDAS